MLFILLFGCTMVVAIFFFFQAEDGIRDPLVTGVQTCALPIWLVTGSDLGVTESRVSADGLGLIGALPGEPRLGASKVAVGGGRPVDGPLQVQGFDNSARREREVRANDLGDLLVRN